MLLLALLSCTAKDPDDSAAPGDGGEDPACALLTDLSLPERARPGEDAPVGLGADPLALLDFDPSVGEIVPAGEGLVAWRLPADQAIHVDETHTLRVLARKEGCPDEERTASLTLGFTEEERVLVLYNPLVDGSESVARAYQDLHALDEGQLCPVASEATVILAGADLGAYLNTVQACIEAVGPQVHALVPVWGTPYKVDGRIDDIGSTGVKATVSLDALLVYGDGAAGASQAIWSPLYQDGDSMAGEFDPYVPWGLLREDLDDPAYMVTRIDGVDAQASIDLVDRTAAAMALATAGGLDGIVYVDGRMGDTPPATDEFGSYEGGEWNMWGTRTVFEDLAWYPVVWDGNDAEFGTKPAPTDCPDALYFAGWYSYGTYNDCFTWAPGAIGGHLDSCSACDLRGGTTWSTNALQRGITATFGAVNEPYVAGMPEYDQLFLYLSQGASYGEAAYEATVVGLWMMVFVGDPLYRPYPDQVPPS